MRFQPSHDVFKGEAVDWIGEGAVGEGHDARGDRRGGGAGDFKVYIGLALQGLAIGGKHGVRQSGVEAALDGDIESARGVYRRRAGDGHAARGAQHDIGVDAGSIARQPPVRRGVDGRQPIVAQLRRGDLGERDLPVAVWRGLGSGDVRFGVERAAESKCRIGDGRDRERNRAGPRGDVEAVADAAVDIEPAAARVDGAALDIDLAALKRDRRRSRQSEALAVALDGERGKIDARALSGGERGGARDSETARVDRDVERRAGPGGTRLQTR